MQTADGKDVRKTARLHVAVKQVVYASLVAYHESAGDDGRVLVHMFVKQAADFELNAEYEIRLSRGEELRAVRPYRKISPVQHIRRKIAVERFVTGRDQFALDCDYVADAEIGSGHRDIHAAFAFEHLSVHRQVFDIELRRAVLDDYLARNPCRKRPAHIVDKAGVVDVGSARTGNKAR